MKKALVIGINYEGTDHALDGCVNDAREIASKLKTHGNGDPNFDVECLVSNENDTTTMSIHDSIRDIFEGDAEIVVIYFAGHGLLDNQINDGFLVTTDGSYPNWGVSLSSVLSMANKAYPHIRSTVIILDSCQSGFMGDLSIMSNSGLTVIGEGVTILTACHKLGTAEEQGTHGKFTDVLLDGLSGAACDILGRITPAALYAYVDQTLGPREQRPIYKANVQSFITLRQVEPKVPKKILRKLIDYFPTPSSEYALDPSYEPDRGEETEKLKQIEVKPENEEIYRELQQCNRFGLVVPTKHEHMWHSAVYSGGCRLTATGAHYRKLAEKGFI